MSFFFNAYYIGSVRNSCALTYIITQSTGSNFRAHKRTSSLS